MTASLDGPIVVAGDVCIDWLGVAVKEWGSQENKGELWNWQLRGGTHTVARPGGALLLARMVESATGRRPIQQAYGKPLDRLLASEAIRSIIELDCYPREPFGRRAETTVYRVKRFHGFAGPEEKLPEIPTLAGDDPTAEIVVLDDSGNGYRGEEESWPKTIKSGGTPWIVYKMASPLATGRLWEHVTTHHRDRLVVVVSADDLRDEGVLISRRLSWERTAKEFVWQLAGHQRLRPLWACRNLIVRLGIDAAIHHQRASDGRVESTLFYDPTVAEDEWAGQWPGMMSGYTCAFVAALTAGLAGRGPEGIREAILQGIRSSRRLLREGFGTDWNKLDYPVGSIFQSGRDEGHLTHVTIPPPSSPGRPDPELWAILKQGKRGRKLEQIACEIVSTGYSAVSDGIPEGRFGALRTVDRVEIESYRSIKNLIDEYLAQRNPARPLCLAVFGPPGSGKSFGVVQVALSVARADVKIEKMEFNLSQFERPEQIAESLQLVRDQVLGGKVPLVFFDEFDTDRGGQRLGWLRYFLAPMQDGTFRDRGTIHPIGRAIFVFAGGTHHSYERFFPHGAAAQAPASAKGESDGPTPDRDTATEEPPATVSPPAASLQDDPNRLTRWDEFVRAKGPDFVSRLRGYIDILGPNPANEHDEVFVIRRGVLLRSLIERKAPQLLSDDRRACIDSGVLRAMLKVSQYRHGVRSMEAILEMSTLSGRSHFDQAALPSPTQLKLHVDSEEFIRLVLRDALFGAAREQLGRRIHEQYLANEEARCKKEGRPFPDPEKPAHKPWTELAEDYQESSRRQADYIPVILDVAGYDFCRAPEGAEIHNEFDQETLKTKLDLMAEMEHERWRTEKQQQGWVYGKPRDDANKRHPDLVPWDQLDEPTKDKDRNAVKAFPKLLADAGFQMFRVR